MDIVSIEWAVLWLRTAAAGRFSGGNDSRSAVTCRETKTSECYPPEWTTKLLPAIYGSSEYARLWSVLPLFIVALFDLQPGTRGRLL
ncbi:hypothetical protein [Cupriavidus sp. CP313]